MLARLGWAIGVALAIYGCTTPPLVAEAVGQLDPLQVQFRYDSRTGFPDGTSGKGDVILAERAGTYNVLWRAGDVQSWTGLAREADGLFGVVTLRFPRENPRSDDILGLAIYRIAGGDLVGTRVEEGDRARQPSPERLTGPATLDGRFEIAEAGPLSPAKAKTGAYVKITPNGATFLVSWIDPPFSINGVGVRIGEHLFVGYSNRALPAITVLCQAGAELKGLGTTGSRPTLSFVTLSPRDTNPPTAMGGPCLDLLNAANGG